MSDLAHIARIEKATTMVSTLNYLQKMSLPPEISAHSPKLHVLVVDEDEASRSACVEIAEGLGYKAEGISRLSGVRSTLIQFPTDIIVIDLPTNSDAGLETVAEINALHPRISIIAMAP